MNFHCDFSNFRLNQHMGLISYLKLLFLLFMISQSHAWDSEELEIFDVVEEVNENFYSLMGISQDATLSDIKKAYRTLSKQLHPDKNDSPDAEIKFRQLVSVYEVLRDEGRRARYNRVLVEGLPDWRSPIYYYRRARKMSLIEISIILTVVISITQYLMAWGSYLDRKHTLEDQLCRKYKIKDRRKRKPEDLDNQIIIESELNKIPRPRWWNILPVQLVQLTIFLITNGPSLVHSSIIALKEERQRKEEEKLRLEEEEKRMKEEEERRKEKKAQMKSRKRVQNLPDYSGEGDDEPYANSTEHQKAVRPASQPEPIIIGGLWTEDDFNELARLMGKYPGGTSERWEKIASQMNRTVFEVTKMSSKVKAELMNRMTNQEITPESIPEIKVKQKTKGGKLGAEGGEKIDINLGADEAWSVIQQKNLEKALKQFPKGTDQRWDRIARMVPDKEKEDCMMRFKFLAEKIRKKREEKENELIEDSSEPVESEKCHKTQQECVTETLDEEGSI